jgi:NTE family protein
MTAIDVPGPAPLACEHRRRVAFVLGGGGSLAAGQVGMLRALTEAGIVPDFVIGTSAGAINAAVFAARPTAEGIDRLEAQWRSLRRRDIAQFSLPTVVRAMTGRSSWLVANTGLRRLLHSELQGQHLEDGQLAAYVVATEPLSGAVRVLGRGDATQAVLASTAIPGLFPPVIIDGCPLVDGGITANLPVAQAEALGATDIYVLTAARPAPTPPAPPGALEVALRALNRILDTAPPVSPGVHLLPAAPSPTANILDFRHTSRFITDSYQLAAQWLAHHQPATPAAA